MCRPPTRSSEQAHRKPPGSSEAAAAPWSKGARTKRHDRRRRTMISKSVNRAAALGAMVVGIAAGSYGIASAASGSSSASSDTTATTTIAAPTLTPSGAPPGVSAQNPWGGQRSDETLLTGDALAKVDRKSTRLNS